MLGISSKDKIKQGRQNWSEVFIRQEAWKGLTEKRQRLDGNVGGNHVGIWEQRMEVSTSVFPTWGCACSGVRWQGNRCWTVKVWLGVWLFWVQLCELALVFHAGEGDNQKVTLTNINSVTIDKCYREGMWCCEKSKDFLEQAVPERRPGGVTQVNEEQKRLKGN